MVLKEINPHKVDWNKEAKYREADWEEIPKEELWEDGELSPRAVNMKIIKNVLQLGEWKLIRRIDNGKKESN